MYCVFSKLDMFTACGANLKEKNKEILTMKVTDAHRAGDSNVLSGIGLVSL